MVKGQIRQSLSGFYDVVDDTGIEYRTRARGNFRSKKITPIVGDKVEFKEGYLLSILPRSNELLRPLVANVDQAIIASSVVCPDFSSNLLDRQLLALEIAGIKPIIYFTKTDLLSVDRRSVFETLAANYRKIDYVTIMPKRAFDESSLTLIYQQLTGKISVFMGQSGAGKSTLLNHIAPELNLITGKISRALNRGKHTTRRVRLIPLFDGLVADTPGFSSYTDFNIESKDLGYYFPEFRSSSIHCRFRGCVHVNEPDCGVKSDVTNGNIMQSRYDNYLSFYLGIQKQKPKYKK